MQYTLRNIPEAVDAALRERARVENKSLNQVVLEAVVRALGLGVRAIRYRDLSGLTGRWREDADFDRAIADQDQVDEELWK